MSTGADALYHLEAARSEEQRRYMEKLEDEGICVFCPAHFETHHREPVELAGEHWYVTKNDYPYTGTRAHYLIVPHVHVSSFEDLPDEAGAELWALRRQLKARLDPLAVATIERSGDMRYNGGSVAHLHIHFVALDEAPAKTVRFRVSRKPRDGAQAPTAGPPAVAPTAQAPKEIHGDHERHLQL
jgi:ATP adenylyltransferase